MEMGLSIRHKGIHVEVFLKVEATRVYYPVVISESSLQDVLVSALYSTPFLSYRVIHPIDRHPFRSGYQRMGQFRWNQRRKMHNTSQLFIVRFRANKLTIEETYDQKS